MYDTYISEKTGGLIVRLRQFVLTQMRERTHTFSSAERPLAGTGSACLDSFSVTRKYNIQDRYVVQLNIGRPFMQ